MTTYSNDQANLLLGKAATSEAYNDVPLRGTTTNDGRVLTPGYALFNPIFAGAEVGAPGTHEARLDSWVNVGSGNAIVSYAGTYNNTRNYCCNC